MIWPKSATVLMRVPVWSLLWPLLWAEDGFGVLGMVLLAFLHYYRTVKMVALEIITL